MIPADKVAKLIRIAQQRGYTTYAELNEQLPNGELSPEELEEVYIRLRTLDIEVRDESETA